MLVARRRPIDDPSRSSPLPAWTNGVQGLVMKSWAANKNAGGYEISHFVAS